MSHREIKLLKDVTSGEIRIKAPLLGFFCITYHSILANKLQKSKLSNEKESKFLETNHSRKQ